jgi:type I restriction enzyme M protein
MPYIIDQPVFRNISFKSNEFVTSHVKLNSKEYKADLEAEEFFLMQDFRIVTELLGRKFYLRNGSKIYNGNNSKSKYGLHGDGSAHIYKYDAFKDFNLYDANKLRVAPENMRSIPRAKYSFDTTESFDLVVSNPPFGVTLNSDTKSKLSKVFSLREALPSESLFY